MRRREQLLDIADQLWRKRGYAGFSYADLARESALHKATIHHHFAKKSDLVEALIARHRDEAVQFANAHAPAPPRVALDAFLDTYESLLQTPDLLCAAGTISADLEVLPEPAAGMGRAYLTGQRAWLARRLAQTGASAHPGELADTVLAALQGGLQRARAEGEPERLRAVLRELRRLLGLDADSGLGPG